MGMDKNTSSSQQRVMSEEPRAAKSLRLPKPSAYGEGLSQDKIEKMLIADGSEEAITDVAGSVWRQRYHDISYWLKSGSSTGGMPPNSKWKWIGNEAEGARAVAIAGALGWVDAIRLLLAVPEIAKAAAVATQSGFALPQEGFPQHQHDAPKGGGFELAAPSRNSTSFKLEKPQAPIHWGNEGDPSLRSYKYTALGFACINGQERAAKVLVENHRLMTGCGGALRPAALFNFGDRACDGASAEGRENAIVWAWANGQEGVALALAVAGGGSLHMAEELEWAERSRNIEALEALMGLASAGPGAAKAMAALESLRGADPRDEAAPSERPEPFATAPSPAPGETGLGHHKKDHVLRSAELVEAAVRGARRSRQPAKNPDFSVAMLERDLASAAAWVAADSKSASKLARAVGSRGAAAADALCVAAAMGWTDGVKLALAAPSMNEKGVGSALRWGHWARGQGMGAPEWAPVAPQSTPGGGQEPDASISQPSAAHAYTALGFASINLHVEAARALVHSLRHSRGGGGALPIASLRQEVKRRGSFFFKAAGKGGAGAVAEVEDCRDNVVIFAMMNMIPGAAQTLAEAGAGSPGLAQELAWAAKRGLLAEARMLVEACPQRAELSQGAGEDILALAIGAGDIGFAKNLARMGVDTSSVSIQGVPLAKAFMLDSAQCWEMLSSTDWDLDERERGMILALAKHARSERSAAQPEPNEEALARGRQGADGLAENPPAQNSQAKKNGPEESSSLPSAAEQAEPASAFSAADLGAQSIAEAISELQGFEVMVAQMGTRIRQLIQGLEARAELGPSAGPKGKPGEIGLMVKQLKTRAGEASGAIAKASEMARRGP